MRRAVSLFLVAVLSSVGVVCGDEPLIGPASVRKVYDDGRHNVFTALVRWKDAYGLSFRNAESHAYGEADLIVLRSLDGEKWTEAHRVNALPDDRDPQFLATENRLFLYDPTPQRHDALPAGPHHTPHAHDLAPHALPAMVAVARPLQLDSPARFAFTADARHDAGPRQSSVERRRIRELPSSRQRPHPSHLGGRPEN